MLVFAYDIPGTITVKGLPDLEQYFSTLGKSLFPVPVVPDKIDFKNFILLNVVAILILILFCVLKNKR